MGRTQRRNRDVSLDEGEIAKFAALAGEWWDPDGKFAALHRLNPVRLGFLREIAARHFARDPRALAPFEGLALVDIGCGGGLLSEPLARMGFDVLGIDAAEEGVEAAAAHAAETATPVAYRCTSAEQLAAEGRSFDAVVAMEVIEHVADLEGFVDTCASLVRPGGLLFAATINRTLKALALAKIGAEYVLGWVPPGTHDWQKFVTPRELHRLLEGAGLAVEAMKGAVFDPLAWAWRLSSDTDVNYMVAARAPFPSDEP